MDVPPTAPADPRAEPAPPPALAAYEVGGAVRDALLGLPVHDRDWVVVGTTPERMVELGFRPVGRDFPVFLHPDTHEEYALARTERKTGRGYRGFVVHCAPDVTLEEDLRRRDLTINAMARAPDGTLVDPSGGEADLRAGVLRHVGEAFVEDPVRILRLARFAARFEAFSVAPETRALMRAMVEAGEVDALVPERVWQEVSRGLGERTPSRMLAVLDDCGALPRLVPGLAVDAALLRALDATADAGRPVPVRLATLLHRLGPDGAEAACLRLKAPNDARELAVPVAREHGRTGAAARDADAALALIERCDAIRKPARLEGLRAACDAIRTGDPSAGAALADTEPLAWALAAARAVDAGAIAATVAKAPGEGTLPERIRAAVHAARARAAREAMGGGGT